MSEPIRPPEVKGGTYEAVESINVRMGKDGPNVAIVGMEGGAGIWIDAGDKAPMLALFNMTGPYKQAGIGIYGPDPGRGACAICLAVDDKGAGFIQFSDGKRDDLRVAMLTLDDVLELKALLAERKQKGEGP